MTTAPTMNVTCAARQVGLRGQRVVDRVEQVAEREEQRAGAEREAAQAVERARGHGASPLTWLQTKACPTQRPSQQSCFRKQPKPGPLHVASRQVQGSWS